MINYSTSSSLPIFRIVSDVFGNTFIGFGIADNAIVVVSLPFETII
jgi:hypothetical protein